MRNNVIFFSPIDVLYNINNSKIINEPNLNTIYEPYLILVDERLKKYLDQKEKKDKYLEDNHIEIKSFFNDLKLINIEKPHYSVFSSVKIDKDKEADEDNDEEINNINTDSKNENEDENNEKKEDNKSVSSSSEICQNINFNEIYPKKMFFTNFKSIDDSKIPKEIYDFYFLFNLYYNFIYQTMKEMKTIFVDYDIIKRYIASIESSVTISFSDYDRTIIKSARGKGDDNIGDVKKIKKNTKKSIIKVLTIMSKLTRMTRHMNYIFIDYVNKIINDIINDGANGVAQKNADNKQNFIKIGHYIINFLAYEKNGTFFNSYNYFKGSEICHKLEDDSIYLDALNMNSQK